MLLEAFENKLRALFEGTLDRLLYPGVSMSLSSRLVALISEKIASQPSDSRRAPDLIDILICPDKWDAWQNARAALDDAARELEAYWVEQGYSFLYRPRIRVIADPELNAEAVDIRIDYAQDDNWQGKTALQTIPRQVTEEPVPANAYLIINGKAQAALEKAVINIGRRSTSDIILNDPMISRDHVQLRAEQGKFLLFDLSSTGGTFVNNRKVHTAVLKPGDVIRLGKTLLVYNQELTAPAETKTTLLPTHPES
ncbi:MAG TPA: FHA domain-containing protein [Anaerolineaceae bacterium]|jgi:pSer/pThr/pTyr-binding forkhead associated (FHA) protein|nr:FHA domain-containing protein [Anaerolineaceae bacterium]NMD26549.1 FHA domain-containing protein [Chloroflexota bacterium]HOA21315.1 FHA domain-containing protein [Anaerolineaceae bacterium]HOG77386.1 FHA domain-containing protein [Anaerolineaceae bacterium]